MRCVVRRHAFTEFAPLAALQCSLGTVAAIMGASETAEIDGLLAQENGLSTLPVPVVYHVLLCSVAIPLLGSSMSFEAMENLAGRLAELDGSELLERVAERAEERMQQEA